MAAKQEDAAGSGVRLLWNPDNVKDVAESVGIAQLGDDAMRCLAQDVEYRIGQVLVESLRFMRAAGRTTLTVQDVSLALHVLDVEPLYGYESTRPLRFGEASIGPGQPLFYVEDEEVEFEKLVNAPLPRVPRDVSLTAHWLAIEGVQPSIPQNPTTAEAAARSAAGSGAGGGAGGGGGGSATAQDMLVAKAGGSGSGAGGDGGVDAAGGSGGSSANAALAALAGSDAVGFKPAVKHMISNELVLYFDKIQAAILDDSPDDEVVRLREAALESVRSDPGLHQLVPYFVSFVATQITHRIDDVTVLRRMMELTAALVENPHVFLDPYVTPLCAPVLTCLLGHKLGGGADTRDVYLLREFAASLLGLLARKFAKSSALLRPKLTRTCLKTLLEPDRPVGVLFGAVAGLSAAGGPEAVRVLLLPNLKTFDTYVLQPLQERVASGASSGASSGGADAAVEFEMLVAGGLVKAIRTLVDVPVMANGAVAGGHAGDQSDDAVERAELVDFLGPTVGQLVAALGDGRLNAVILEARNIE